MPPNATCQDFYDASPEARNRYSGFRLLEARNFTMPTEQEINAFFGFLALNCASDERQATPLETVAEQVLQENASLLS